MNGKWPIMCCRLQIDYMKKPLFLAKQRLSFGAGEMNRTPDLLITNDRISIFGCVDLSNTININQQVTSDVLDK